MKCEEFLRLMDNGGPVQEGDAAEHMLECDTCRQAFKNWQEVSGGLSAMKDEQPPPFLHARIMAHVREEADVEPARSGVAEWLRSRWLAPASLVVVAATIGGIALVTSFNRSVDKQPPLPAPHVQAPARASEGPLALEKAPAHGAASSHEAKGHQGELPPPPLDRLSHPVNSTERPSPTPGNESFDQSAPSTGQAPGAPESEIQATMKPQQPPLFGSSGQAEPDEAAPQPPPAPRQTSPALAKKSAVRAPLSAPDSGHTEKAEESSRPTMVLCLLSTLDHARFASVQMPSDSVPPPGQKWYVSIFADGGMSVTDAHGRPLDRRIAQSVSGYVSMLNLPAGRYRLTQVGS